MSKTHFRSPSNRMYNLCGESRKYGPTWTENVSQVTCVTCKLSYLAEGKKTSDALVTTGENK